MKIEIWSDYLCPFCYIGKRKFENALVQFPHKDNVEVVFRSFELGPDAPKDPGLSMDQILASKYGMSLEQAKAANDNVASQAQTVGLTYHFDTMIPTNSFDAHRLTHYAAAQGKGAEMQERLFQAYFTDSSHIGDRETLAQLAAEIGLDRNEASAVLASDQYAQDVRADEQEGSQLGIKGVPFFVINRKYAVSGAQPSEVFLEALQKAWGEEHN
ncbi:DsbA family oxidoreductase [Paenibacillus mendelii]|uniref:DsbA family oxidoreductase n=1 Tax=Paenibacillus mendelii TaxID=206163 RepID=A0ABV6J6S5_9BACL|nr:DsbA family oxidoreductase [Paenibacillus mendelii]MCQ6561041.1 DsbA family oxidoreductase [Paenibacillus mendelii]